LKLINLGITLFGGTLEKSTLRLQVGNDWEPLIL